jgi:AcrR family transcriptional regulator
VVVTSPVELPPNALTLRERKKRETRASLIAAALRLVDERGLAQVTVEEISAAANVSVRTFFNYFRNKEDAVTGGGVIAGERMTEALRETPADVPLLTAVHRAMLTEAAAIEKDPDELLLVLSVAERSPALKPQLVASGEDVLQDFAAAIGRRVGLDPATHGYPGLVANVCGAVYRHAVFRWHAVDRSEPLTALVDDAFCALAAGLPEPV